MNANQQYEKAYLGEEVKQLRKTYSDVCRVALETWDSQLLAERKKRQPRRRKNFDPLPTEWLATLRQSLFERHKIPERQEEIKVKGEEAEQLMEKLASDVRFVGDDNQWWVVYSCSTSTYGSQTQPHFYAKSACKPLEAQLHSLGLTAEIHYQQHYKYGGDYQLWANCPPWMADAAKRQLTWDTVSKAVGRTANVCALYPGLPVSALEDHYNRT